MAANRTLELTLISAKDLKGVNLLSRMEVFAVASVDGDRRTEQRTPTDRSGGTNPSWNKALRIPITPGDPSRHTIRVLLRAERALGNRDVGEVRIPLAELLSGGAKGPQFVSYQVRLISSGKAKGVLNISYTVSDPSGSAAFSPAAVYPPPPKVDSYPPANPTPPASTYPLPPASKVNSSSAAYLPPASWSKVDEPVTAYPAGPSAYPASAAYGQPATSAPYPAPQQGYPGYPPPPPPAGYGYPYGGGGYGYGMAAVPPQQQPPRKNNFGMGLGAGLLGGALGGLLIGEALSDDAGYDDGGGFF